MGKQDHYVGCAETFSDATPPIGKIYPFNLLLVIAYYSLLIARSHCSVFMRSAEYATVAAVAAG